MIYSPIENVQAQRFQNSGVQFALLKARFHGDPGRIILERNVSSLFESPLASGQYFGWERQREGYLNRMGCMGRMVVRDRPFLMV